MRKVTMFALSLFVFSLSVQAQEEHMSKYPGWDPHPKMHAIPPAYLNEHAVMIYQDQRRDYVYEGSGVTLYSTIHKLIKVLDKRGIEEFNIINVPFRHNYSRIDSIRARTILPDGTTHDIKYEMLYGSSQSIFFALDGVEKNAEIEILVKYKELSSLFGSIHFQYDIPVLNTFFELNYPKEMSFNTKGYHGFPSGTETMVGGHKQVKMYVADIPGLESQPQSYYDLYLMRLDYAIDHFTTRGGYQAGETYSWDKFAQKLYKENYNFKKSELTAVSKFLTTVGIRGAETEAEKIKMIEDGIKSGIVQYDYLRGSDINNLDTIITKKSATEEGMTRLFCACFKMAGVHHELGKVSNREEHLLDSKFVNWDPLDNTVFYFPRQDAYLSPNSEFLRYPEIPHQYISNKGVFCKTNPEAMFNVGSDLIAPDAVIRTIPSPAPNYSKMDEHADITFNSDLEPQAEVVYSFTGYGAADLREELAKANGEEKKKLIEKQIHIADQREKIIRYNTVNEALNAVYKSRPLEIKATVRVPQLMDKAGARYLFKIGDVIGSQMNMYDKQQRVLPVDIDYPYTQTRVITVNLPQGTKILNPEALKTYAEQGDPNTEKVTAYFKSDYTLNGNKLTVTINETYKQTHYPVFQFDSYKKVVNAAADFNKVALLLEVAKTNKMKPKAKAPAAKPVAKPAAKHA